MPLYEYQCEKCGKIVEIIQKFSDPPLSECEKCGGELERLLSAPAFQFKGSGWYVTDYGPKKNGKNSESPGKEKKKVASDSSAKDSSGSKKNKSSK